MSIPLEDWRKLPLALRQRWWRETDYSTLQPTPELEAAIKRHLEDDMTPGENHSDEVTKPKPADDEATKAAEQKPADEQKNGEDDDGEGEEDEDEDAA